MMITHRMTATYGCPIRGSQLPSLWPLFLTRMSLQLCGENSRRNGGGGKESEGVGRERGREDEREIEGMCA